MPAAPAQGLPLYRDVAWDYEENRPKFRGGSPVLATGREAVLSWAYRALQTGRFCHPIYTGELKQAEAIRYLRECPLCNPYIQGVREIIDTEIEQQAFGQAYAKAALDYLDIPFQEKKPNPDTKTISFQELGEMLRQYGIYQITIGF